MKQDQITYSNPAKQERYDRAYLKMAVEWAKLSHCTRKKVGALLVKDGMIISDGYNGTPSGFPNDCEDEHGETNWYVLHAEANAIMKVARSTNAAKDSTLYITLSPCRECCKLILQAGIRRMVFRDLYKDDTAILFLRDSGIEVCQISEP
jgi:dCMP deaminase